MPTRRNTKNIQLSAERYEIMIETDIIKEVVKTLPANTKQYGTDILDEI